MAECHELKKQITIIPMDQASLPQQELHGEKRQLRRACRQVRKELGEAARQQASLAICARIEAWSVFHGSSVILTYMPIPGEVDLVPLLERQPQKRWVLPRILPDEKGWMNFHPYKPGRLIRHPFGMDEPAPDLPLIPASEIQLALVPGLAYDRAGRRLGYGGGYFDRFLRGFTGVSLGVTFRALMLDQLPFEEHDISVQWIVTEDGVVEARAG